MKRRQFLEGVALCLLASFVLAGCERQKETGENRTSVAELANRVEQEPQWAQYLLRHSGENRPAQQPITVEFARDAISVEQLEHPADKVVSIKPSIDAKISFRSPRMLVIEPAKPLPSGSRYTVTLHADEMSGIPDDLSEYSFEVGIIRQDFELVTDGITPDPAVEERFSFTGSLRTADVAAPAAVEKVLSGKYRDAPLSFSWTHGDDNRLHMFSVSGLERTREPHTLQLEWNGQPLGVERQGEESIDVPPLGVFQLTSATLDRDRGQQIELRFSEPVDPNQDLSGLVQIDDVPLRLTVDGNRILVFPSRTLEGRRELRVSPGIRGRNGDRLKESFRREFRFQLEKPQVRFVGDGVILPAAERLEIPFETVNVKSVQVTAFQVYADNIGQFLQSNDLDDNRGMERVGRHLWRRTIELPNAIADEWQRYSIDASELLRDQPGAMFRLALSINRGNSIYTCSEAENAVPPVPEASFRNYESASASEASGWDGIEEWFNTSNDQVSWSDRENPCKDGYYRYGSGVQTARNFLASDLGLVAKRGDEGKLLVAVNALQSATAMSGVELDVRNFQNQPIAKAVTDKEGMAVIAMDATPFYVIARKGDRIGYLKLDRGSALPTSHFDVGGSRLTAGAKGHIYGERGVWRPGDDIHLTFALDDRGNRIPDGHPVTMQLVSPRGQIVQTVTNHSPVGDFYRFDLATDESAETGNWTAKAHLGGATFQRTLKIETIMPNRLKIDLDFPQEVLRVSQMPLQGSIASRWLHGAKAPGLKYDIKARLLPRATRFGRFADFEFDDPARQFNSQEIDIAESRLDASGNGEFPLALKLPAKPPGMLTAAFTTRVFEQGGAFSTSVSSRPVHPFSRYVGVKLPEGDARRNMLRTDEDHVVQVALLDDKGEPVSADGIEVSVFKIDWKWWWDDSGDNLTQFANANYRSSVSRSTVATDDNGLAQYKLRIDHPAWGRYLLRACDQKGGHCTGRIFYIDWPGWAGRAKAQGGEAANILTLEADKERYVVGDTAVLSLPAMAKGRALLTVENSREVVSARWLELDGEKNTVEIPVTRGMAPNVYAAVTLIQPHQGKDNDRPIRLYGVVPLLVDDPSTRIEPRVVTADTWQPRKAATVSISEASGRAMHYTLAVVDEGLLGLTNFHTPELHGEFYQREALGVMTWDLYDHVVGAYGGSLERLLALGGGDSGESAGEKARERRFPPVVEFLGPFELPAGETREHEIQLAQYIGEVRVMVVAGNAGAYGSAEKSVAVREPVSLLATLPRVLGPGEEVEVPVSVFAYDDRIKAADVSIETGELAEVMGETVRRVTFANDEEEQIARFRLKTSEAAGPLKIVLRANGGGHSTQDEVNLQVRNANSPEVRVTSLRLAPGEELVQRIEPHGIPGTNSLLLGASALPDFGLERRLSYLVRYPHGCVEQTTSAAFPQVYLPQILKLPDDRQAEIENNVHAGINRLQLYQNGDGQFMYWPGSSWYSDWSDIYAGHFLVEADRLGFTVPESMLDRWLDAQRAHAQRWMTGSGEDSAVQAYRLFVMATAGQPDVASMNRLGRSGSMDALSHWMLANAYARIGLDAEARQQLQMGGRQPRDYRRPGDHFGSALRDRAVLLMSSVLVDDAAQSETLARMIGEELASDRWHSTQSTAFGLSAIAQYVMGGNRSGVALTLGSTPNDSRQVRSEKPLFQQELAIDESKASEYFLKNESERPLYLTLLATGTPPPGSEQAYRSELAVEVEFHADNGETIDPSSLRQGVDVIATVVVHNRSDSEIKHLALTHVVPSGWEIANERLAEGGESSTRADYDYRDIRDDRVLTYFGLKRGESRRFQLRFTPSYAGRYYMPGVAVEDMYDAKLSSRTSGQWVEVLHSE